MKKLKIYLDTSVIGGCFDYRFKEYSNRLIENIKNYNVVGVISEITIRELEYAPDFVKEYFDSYEDKLEVIIISDEIRTLAKNYIEDAVVSEQHFEDALHIACATVNQIDVLVSWNFKHIVNFNRIIKFNAVNIKNGYKALQIFSPMEVLTDEGE